MKVKKNGEKTNIKVNIEFIIEHTGKLKQNNMQNIE